MHCDAVFCAAERETPFVLMGMAALKERTKEKLDILLLL
jgi:hypothetical protein